MNVITAIAIIIIIVLQAGMLAYLFDIAFLDKE